MRKHGVKKEKKRPGEKSKKCYRIICKDNGCGIARKDVQRVLGNLGHSSKKSRQQARGKVGLGVKMAFLYSFEATQCPILTETASSNRHGIFQTKLFPGRKQSPIDAKLDKVIPNKDKWVGTRIEIFTLGLWNKSDKIIKRYLELVPLVNRNIQIDFEFTPIRGDPVKNQYGGNQLGDIEHKGQVLARFDPRTIDRGTLEKEIRCSEHRTITRFLTNEFMYIGSTEATDIVGRMKLSSESDTELNNITDNEQSRLHKILKNYKYNCSGGVITEGLFPVGEYFRSSIMQYVRQCISSELSTRETAFMGYPFVVEALITIGAKKMTKGLNIYRFANRAPLVLEEHSDLVTSVASHHINWRKYNINLAKNHVGIFVSLVGTQIPFNNILKEYMCNAEVIETAIKEALIACCQDLVPKMDNQEEVRRNFDVLANILIPNALKIRKDTNEKELETLMWKSKVVQKVAERSKSKPAKGKLHSPRDDEGRADATQVPPTERHEDVCRQGDERGADASQVPPELEKMEDTFDRIRERQEQVFIRFTNVDHSNSNDTTCECHITGLDLIESFAPRQEVVDITLDYFCHMLAFDDIQCTTQFQPPGDRAILPSAFTNMLAEGKEGQDGFKGHKVRLILQEHIGTIRDARLICLPFLYHEHWTYYCLNMDAQHIYVLDSLNRKSDAFEERAISHLEEELATLWPEAPHFTQWAKTYVNTPMQESLDCGIFVMKFLEYWNGTDWNEQIDPTKVTQYRLEYLVRLLHHEENMAKAAVENNLGYREP